MHYLTQHLIIEDGYMWFMKIKMLLLLLFSCAFPYCENWYNIDLKKEFKDEKEIYNWVIKNIKYKKDDYDFWQLPQESLNLGTGDCEDRALLMMAIYFKVFGKKSEFWLVDTENNWMINHAMWIVDGKSIEKKDFNAIFKYKFDRMRCIIYWNRNKRG